MIRPGLARLAAAGAAAMTAAALAGCVTLFPKEKPVQLYRFEAQAPAAQGGRAFAIRMSGSGNDLLPLVM